MSLLVLMLVSILLGVAGLSAFFWALRNGQFEDPDGAAWRVIPTDGRPHEKGMHHDGLATDAAHKNTAGRL
ncbi:MAG: cbb3-type cytochrome oxidase assembly protein CcoS [Brucellaceae bacterium]|nr:cbb3-type cytochrome oxidase assembly protein CcoS [Notoacmeibacter sp.]MCC0026793.1 cbb3-type cytochrome oxidase assembly protein CcoS [Brucellaceae bacterium]